MVLRQILAEIELAFRIVGNGRKALTFFVEYCPSCDPDETRRYPRRKG